MCKSYFIWKIKPAVSQHRGPPDSSDNLLAAPFESIMNCTFANKDKKMNIFDFFTIYALMKLEMQMETPAKNQHSMRAAFFYLNDT